MTDTVDDDDEPMPRTDLAAALAWLEERGPVERAARGALPGAVVALRHRLGRALPAGLVEFLQTYHWIDTGGVATLAVEGDARTTIEQARREIAAHVEATWRALPQVDAATRARGEALRAWIPVAEIGNPLPFGSALLLDEAGSFRCVPVREFASANLDDCEAEPEFEAALLTALAEWHDG